MCRFLPSRDPRRGIANAGLLLLLVACAGGDGITEPGTTPVAVPVITMPASAITLETGASQRLTATVSGVANTAVLWRSSADAVAAVSPDGEVTARAPGSATIIARAAADTSVTVSAVVTVMPPIINVSDSLVTLAVGTMHRLVATVTRARDTGVLWRTSAPAVASVSATGDVSAHAYGTAIIYARAASDTATFDSVLVTVPRPVISILESTLSLEIGRSSQLVATVIAAGSAGITWRTSNASVAAVTAWGEVFAYSAGNATIHAVVASDTSVVDSVLVTVTPPIVNLADSEVTLALGMSRQLIASVSGASDTTVLWQSSSPSVVSVSSYGVASAHAAGTATVYARAAADTSVRDSMLVVVTPPVVSLQDSVPTLEIGTFHQLMATVSGALDGSVLWRTSAPGVVSVTSYGLVTAHAAGSATVYAKATADTSVLDSVIVHVRRPEIRIDTPAFTLEVGKSRQLVATVTGAGNSAVSWRSAAPGVATVAADGTVSAHAVGASVIYAVPVVDSSVVDSALVTVVPAPVPDSIAAIQPVTTVVTAGEDMPAHVLPTAVVLSSDGRPVAGVQVTFATVSGGGTIRDSVVSTDSMGRARLGHWTAGTRAFEYQVVSASVELPGVKGNPVEFRRGTFGGAAVRMSFLRGDGLSARPGRPMVDVPVVYLEDQYGNPAGGGIVTFSVSGGGTIERTTDYAGASGLRGLANPGMWIMSDTPGVNTLTATVAGLPPVTATVHAREEDSPFDISVRTVGIPSSMEPVIADVVHRYRQLIRGALSSQRITTTAGDCGHEGMPAIDTVTTGMVLVIFAADVPGGSGSGTLCRMREDGHFPALGIITLNSGLINGITDGSIQPRSATYLLAHEIAHTLGLVALLRPEFVQRSDSAIYFTGPTAVAEYARRAPGCTRVPMNDEGHWSGMQLDGEVLTAGTPEWGITTLTAGALADMGYTVDMSKGGGFILSTFLWDVPLARC